MNFKRIAIASAGTALALGTIFSVPVFAETQVGVGVGADASVRTNNVNANAQINAKADGMGRRMDGPDGDKDGRGPWPGTSTPILGNGEPVVAGTVSSISGNSITVTTSSKVSYAVDASAAKILKGKGDSTVSNITVGDKVLIQGTVSGTNVYATTVIDQSAAAGTKGGDRSQAGGIFGKIGQFFMRIFGF